MDGQKTEHYCGQNGRTGYASKYLWLNIQISNRAQDYQDRIITESSRSISSPQKLVRTQVSEKGLALCKCIRHFPQRNRKISVAGNLKNIFFDGSVPQQSEKAVWTRVGRIRWGWRQGISEIRCHPHSLERLMDVLILTLSFLIL